MNRKLNIVLFCCLIYTSYCAGQVAGDSAVTAKAREIAQRIQLKYAPDKRTDIFEIAQDVSDTVKIRTTIPAAATEFTDLLKSVQPGKLVKTQMLPGTELGSKVFGIVRLSVSNNRKNPENAAEMVTQMLLGTPIQVLEKYRGYYLVRSPDRYISWVDNDAIALMEKADLDTWQKSEKVVFTADYGYSFSKADQASLRVSDLVKGDILKLEGKEKSFYKVSYPDGRTAYIPLAEAVSYKNWIERKNPTAEQILSTAKTLIGVPYLWGGTSVKGVDCSGFTKTSYFLNGIILPRDASQQALVGEPVDIYEADTVNLDKCLKNLKAGDLLFFAGSKGKTANPKVTHTAIYMGNGEFIQSAGMVRINSMIPNSGNYADYQSRTLVSARRMLTSIGQPQVTRIDQNPFYTSAKK
ncbi:hypothetical protein GS399_11335 [Pedobacter sp. HMF7647]|uniref:NlpC/P60 domain-containing protein n=1 Tax=Hufsiella arboris TaxID=2695275 RepID=A0A7K1YAG4_9SPHI|nr:C40 family peptidase [Hufsiella arboris]MXV51564.1 hypothetical protein [Hufsiella arboris]